jgi:hypothetical protein
MSRQIPLLAAKVAASQAVSPWDHGVVPTFRGDQIDFEDRVEETATRFPGKPRFENFGCHRFHLLGSLRSRTGGWRTVTNRSLCPMPNARKTNTPARQIQRTDGYGPAGCAEEKSASMIRVSRDIHQTRGPYQRYLRWTKQTQIVAQCRYQKKASINRQKLLIRNLKPEYLGKRELCGLKELTKWGQHLVKRV